MCLRYRALDGSVSDWGCSPATPSSGVPQWIARLLRAVGPGHISLQRQISVYGLQVGTLGVESDDASLLQHQWRSVRDLLALSAVTLLALDLLALLVIGRALRPTASILAAVEQLGDGLYELRVPALRPREFTAIAQGINRLAVRLADSDAARAQLTARLFRLQEQERRELAHELHEQFGQCVSALGALSASLRQSVIAGDRLTEADVMPLEIAVEQMLDSLRGMLQRMSQPPLQGQGLRSALADLVTAWQIRVHDTPRIAFDADAGTDSVPNNEYALCVYRVVQECLSNIARHAPASRMACVHIRREAHRLRLRVSNDLGTVTDQRLVQGSGMGLKLRRTCAIAPRLLVGRSLGGGVRRMRGPAPGRLMNERAPVRLLLADDHAIVRAGYRHLLDRQESYTVIAEAQTAEEAYALYRQHRPDVVVTDLAMPGATGLEAIQRILRADAAARVLVFSMHVSPDFALAALRAGALGYVTKSSPPDVLLRAIADVLVGRQVLSPDIAQALALARLPGQRRPLEDLTPREFDVLCMLVSPTSVPDIAQRLHLSVKTVHNLHYQIKAKLAVDSDIELTRLALSWGLDLLPVCEQRQL